ARCMAYRSPGTPTAPFPIRYAKCPIFGLPLPKTIFTPFPTRRSPEIPSSPKIRDTDPALERAFDMNKKNLLLLGLICCACAGQRERGHGKAPAERPSFFVILTDVLGYVVLGAFFQQERAKESDRSEPWHFAPNLDQLARDG